MGKVRIMYIFFDTETTGLPKNWKAPAHDLTNWPRVVQVAWARYDARGRHLDTSSFIVKPIGFSIPREAQRIHGISTAKALTMGKSLKTVLKKLKTAFDEATVVVAHNLRFDENIIGAEFLREGLEIPFFDKHRICTMLESTKFCRLPGPYGHKWPSLAELHSSLFDEIFQEQHDAEVDVNACARCFFELKKRGVIKLRPGRA